MKKVTQKTVNQLRELLEKVISEREDAAPLPGNHKIARILWPVFALYFAGIYLEKTQFFLLIEIVFDLFSKRGFWIGIEGLVTVMIYYYWTWSVPAIVLGAVFFWRHRSIKKEFNALVERAKEEVALGKEKPLETNRKLVRGLEGFLKSLEMEYQFEQKIR